jgi:hypothetical protein
VAVIPTRPYLRWMNKHANGVRTWLLGLAVLLAMTGWLIAPALPADTWLSGQAVTLRGIAAIPAAVAALFEAVRARLNDSGVAKAHGIDERIEQILIELEDTCARDAIASRTYQCGVAVWKLGKLSPKDRRAGETRRPLDRAASRELRYRRNTSGLRWREGMGVMGSAIKNNQVLAVNLDQRWGPLRDQPEARWLEADEATRQGLNHAEFRQSVSDTGYAGPFILAVPYYEGHEPKGVAVLDTPPEMERAVLNSRVDELLWALGQFVLKDRGPTG